MSQRNLTDVAELLEVLGLGSLLVQLSEDLTDLAEQVDRNNKAGKMTLVINLKPHRADTILAANTTLTIEKPKSSGATKEITTYSDLLKISEDEGLIVMSKSEISDTE